MVLDGCLPTENYYLLQSLSTITEAEPREAHGVVRSVGFSEVRYPRRSKFLAAEIERGIGN
eukprot:1317302-Pleurochrysis_carterae.AAC.1